MAKAPEKDEDLSAKFKKLTLQGITPLTHELGRGAYGRVYQVRYGDKLGGWYRGVTCAAKEVHSTIDTKYIDTNYLALAMLETPLSTLLLTADTVLLIDHKSHMHTNVRIFTK